MVRKVLYGVALAGALTLCACAAKEEAPKSKPVATTTETTEAVKPAPAPIVAAKQAPAAATPTSLPKFEVLPPTEPVRADLPPLETVAARNNKPVEGVEPGPVRNDIVPGQFLVDPPTLENLGFRWYVEGDSNRNAKVEVSYRKKGAADWKEALPMLRVYYEVIDQEFNPYRVGNLFAGSVLFLEPATQYEVKFVMTDPDGGTPAEPKTVSVTTRAEPKAFEGGRKLQVFPEGTDVKRLPGPDTFIGLKAAMDAAQPGDILILHPGIYTSPDGGTYTFEKSGTAEKPICLRGSGEGEAILEGAGYGKDLIVMPKAKYLMFENLTLRKARTVIRAGGKGSDGATGLTMRRCKIQDVVLGIFSESENSENFYVADNVFEGINPTWYPRPQNYMSPAHSGLKIYGRGHVVCYNKISRFSDGMAIANWGAPLPDPKKQCVCIDFYNNDLSWAQDDCMETDYGCHNVRAYRNRCYDSHTGISVQPFFGGPVYIIRNEIYAATNLSFKWHNYSSGIMAFNNTLCGANMGFRSFMKWQNGTLRNNLFLGGTKPLYDMETGSFTDYTTMDYDGWRRAAPDRLFKWYTAKQIGRYNSLEELRAGTGLEQHGILVDYDIFTKAGPPEEGKTYAASDHDLTLKPGAVAVDAGVALPQVTDGFTGKAPDLGCYELGQPVPTYGPRPQK